jgi:branched-chain amino acid transport system substrate-binding protein
MKCRWSRAAAVGVLTAAMVLGAGSAFAQKKYDPGASDTEIRIGNTGPYSGPNSIASSIPKTMTAYFKKINAEGGINGRKINFITYDDAFSPPKAVEQVRKLVEGDEVLAVFGTMGTAVNTSIQRYLNQKQVPQLFVVAGASKFNDPKNFPWTMGWQPNYRTEAQIYAKYLLQEKPNAKIAVFYQNDDSGKDYYAGLKAGLGDKAASMIVAEESFEITEPTIDSHIVKLKASGADVFFSFAVPKFAAQAIKRVGELGWKPMYFLSNTAATIGGVIKPAGFEHSQGIISAAFMKDPTDPRWKDDPGMKKFDEFLKQYMPEADRSDVYVVYGYNTAQTMAAVLKACGDNLTRENVMKQAANMKDIEVDGVPPGVKINTKPTNYSPVSQLQLMRIKGETWELFGPVIGADADR